MNEYQTVKQQFLFIVLLRHVSSVQYGEDAMEQLPRGPDDKLFPYLVMNDKNNEKRKKHHFSQGKHIQ